MYPILSFTSEDIWQNLPVVFKDHISVSLTNWPQLPVEYKGDEEFQKRWEKILGLREAVYQRVEFLRQEKSDRPPLVRQPLETRVYLVYDSSAFESVFGNSTVEEMTELLKELLIVSDLKLVESETPIDMAQKIKKDYDSKNVAWDLFHLSVPIKDGDITTYSDPNQAIHIVAAKAPGKKCVRCWHYEEEFSSDSSFSDLCKRCAAVVEGISVS